MNVTSSEVDGTVCKTISKCHNNHSRIIQCEIVYGDTQVNASLGVGDALDMEESVNQVAFW